MFTAYNSRVCFSFSSVSDQAHKVLPKQQPPEQRPLVQNPVAPPETLPQKASLAHSLFSPVPFLCSRSRRRCRYPVLCSLFILAPRKMTMLLGTSLVVTQPCQNQTFKKKKKKGPSFEEQR